MNLLLPFRHTSDDALIWRIGIKRGYRSIRSENPADYITDPGHVYFGNAMHADNLKKAGVALRVERLDPLWLTKLPQEVFGRPISVLKIRPEFLVDWPVKERAFIKCAHEKWFKAQIFEEGQTPQGLLVDDYAYVQPVVQFETEVRCFVIDSTIVTASYYFKNGKLWMAGPIESGDRDYAPQWDDLVDEVAPALPRSVVVDVGLLNGKWVVVEANEVWCSGLYDCDANPAFDAIALASA